MSERRITGLSRGVIAGLVAEVGQGWRARRDAEVCARPRRRAVGAGAKYKPVFVDRPPAAPVHLRRASTHDVLACRLGVDPSTLTRAVAEICPLLADRGCRIAAGVRLRTLADVVAHLCAAGQAGIIDPTEIRFRRPAARQPGRARFVSGKSRMHAVKAPVVTDARGRILFCGEVRAGSVADITHVRDAGLVDLLADTVDLEILARRRPRGSGCTETYGQVVTPPEKAPRRNTWGTCNGAWLTTSRPDSPSPHGASPSSTASPATRTGEPSPGTTATAIICPTQSKPSPAFCPTSKQPTSPPDPLSPHDEQHDQQVVTPLKYALPTTMHELIRACCKG
ncbi:transposase family protein [Streptomyces sp. NPDC020983]|uniref:transposase family protein n=1 Tax=Streptomyces sp. NPDC020983 TaxID=3365106 RepID=UPI0037AA633A